jgi:hypothetical protein
MKIILICSMHLLFLFSCAHTPIKEAYIPCRNRITKYNHFEKRLAIIYNADQEDRKSWFDSTIANINKRDANRRKELAKYFAEGCFKSANDFEKAALVFQHGNVPEHYYQAFIWAKMAVNLGSNTAYHLRNLAIDRYLVNSGYKQLFASQSIKQDNCWCLYPIEPSFTDAQRLSHQGKNLAEQFSWLHSLNDTTTCEDKECVMDLKPVKAGDFCEFW